MAESKKFKDWHRLETAKRSGDAAIVEENVKREMKNVRVEIKQDGKWTEVDRDDPLSPTMDEMDS